MKGQSLIEVVFSIGMVALVISGVVFLILATLGSRTKSYDRKKAVEIAQNVIEGMVQTKNDDGTSFWNLNSAYWVGLGTSQVSNNYFYSVTVSQYSSNGCSALRVECINANVTVGWNNGQKIENFTRFFSRK